MTVKVRIGGASVPPIARIVRPQHMRLFRFMERNEAIARLQQHESELKNLGVTHLFLFGSTVRGEARDDSDVDLFFDYERGRLGLFELMDVKALAAEILERKADVMTRDSLHKTLRHDIEATALQVF
jgi:predicted nucleotidyltransferase